MNVLFSSVLAAVTLAAGKTDVVIERTAPKSVWFAAEEMTNFLSRVQGKDVPIVFAPQAGRTSLILGVNEWSKAAGLDPAALPRDSFQVRVTDDRVLIAGVDDAKADFRTIVEKGGQGGLYNLEADGQRGTLFGVYDFLERFAGVRFYFPSELGTIVPRKASISVPTGGTRVTPAFLVRRPYLPQDGRWPGETDDSLSRNTPKCWTWLRQRFSTCRLQCVHGQTEMRLHERFAKTHPEYFALLKDGHRGCDPEVTNWWQKDMVCQSSGVWEEIYRDARAYLSGEDASVRGIPDPHRKGGFAWGRNAARGMFDVMPADGMVRCECAACQAAYAKSPSESDYATDLLWGQTAKVAQRLIDEKVPGFLTMMAYRPYRAVPTVSIPTNVLVMVAEEGPWSSASEIADQEKEVVAWNRKMKRTIWMWTYPGKHLRKTIHGIPESTPRAYGRYFKRFAPYVFGAFCESESDSSIFNYLNYYVFSRVAWDTSADVDAILAEHHRLMYGAAAPEMARFFDTVEDKWLNGVVGNFVEAEDGTRVRHFASELELFRDVYPPSVLADLRGLFAKALKKVPAGSLEARRIAFVREEFLEPIERKAAAFAAMCDVKAEEARRKAEAGRALPLTGFWKEPKGPGLAVAEDRDVRLTEAFSRRFTKKVTKGSGGDFGTLSYCFPQEGEGALVPGRKYRLSCFVKMKGVRPLNRPAYHSYSGGFRIAASDCGGSPVCTAARNFYIGDADWMAQSLEFTYDPKGKSLKPTVDFTFYVAEGTVWVEGLRIEEAEAAALVANGGFERLTDGRPDGWTLTGDFRAERGEGQNGSVGLVFDSPTPSKAISTASQRITGIRRGDVVRFSALVKKENYAFTDYGAHATLEQRDANGKWLGALYAKVEGKTEDGAWMLGTGDRLVPTNAVDFRLCVIVASGSTGKVAFDNLVIERIGAKPVQFVTTDAYRDTAAAGRVRILASLEVPEASRGRAVARFSWTNAAGKSVTSEAPETTDSSAAITLDVSALAKGPQTIVCTLTDGDVRLGSSEVVFTRADVLPKRRVETDVKGRCRVDGKPFFPLGAYAYPKPSSLRQLADSPFNTILHYKLLTREQLDEIAGYGLKTFSAIDRTLSDGDLAARIDATKDHPALLAWYIGDELQAVDVPNQCRLYRLVRTHDPDHPVYAVQDRIHDLRPFMQTADVLGLDVYPVAQRPIRLVTDFMREGRAMTFDARPHWSVPQMFNWGWHRPAQRAKERFPTEDELRSIAWQHIAGGANGLVAYKLQYDTLGEWERAKRVYREIADRTETLLSDEPVPTLDVSPSDVVCRAWVRGGRLSLVVCNILDRPQKATVRLGAPFGRTLAFDLRPIEVKWEEGIAATPEKPETKRVFFIGDSLIDGCIPKDSARGSWAEMLRPSMADGYEMVNLGVGGTSTRTYRDCKRWKEFEKAAGNGDWLVLTLGRNDASASETRKTTVEEYKANLLAFAEEGRRRGMKVLLVTPVGACSFSREDGRYVGHYQCRLHAAAMRDLAKARGFPLVDLDNVTVDLLRTLGASEANPLYMASVDGKDTTHLTREGARRVAGIFRREALAIGIPFVRKEGE